MPETLVFTTSDPLLGGDDVLLERTGFDDMTAFLQVNGGTAFLDLNEAIALNDQLVALILDAQIRAATAVAVDSALESVGSALGLAR